MKYYSTNKNCQLVTFKQALLQGQALDKGLFMPENIPQLSDKELVMFKDMKYHEIAFCVLSKFLENDLPKSTLLSMVKEAYDFPVPIEKISENLFIMRLDRGPTLSFKDFAARVMARLMNYYLSMEKKRSIILVATSGDTGSAVADAYYNKDNIRVVILFPKGEVSNIQKKQMTTYGKNIYTIAINGKFDDCQKLVKKAFSDFDLNEVNLSSANSINIGRLLPQIVYYFYAYSRICKNKKQIIFSVPSGNFGNLMGGVIAKIMGLPVKKFIVAVNENDEFVDFFKSSKYKPIIPSKNCISNAMNVGNPSNLARLIELYGGHLSEKGEIIKLPDMIKMHQDFFPVTVSDKDTVKTIQRVYKKYNTIIEPHGAVAWKAVEQYKEEYPNENVPIVSLETAHPSKFPLQIEGLPGEIVLPDSLLNIKKKLDINFCEMNNDYIKIKNYIKKLNGE